MKQGRQMSKARNFIALTGDADQEIPGLTLAERN